MTYLRWHPAAALAIAAVAFTTSALAQEAPASQPKGDLVVVVKGDSVYHEMGCPVVKGVKSPQVTMRKRAEHLKLKPHDCQAAMNQALASDPQALVWVDLKTKHYHLPGCSLIGTPRAQVSVQHAKSSYKPCNACKPPR